MSAATHQGIAEQFEALHRQHFHELIGWLKRRLP